MMEAVTGRVPYRNLRKEIELEMATVDDDDRGGHPRPDPGGRDSSDYGSNNTAPENNKHCSLVMLILSCTIAAGVQFGWALQLSLLTPYIQTLGIEHAFSSFIWLCGPITGLVVQPCVGIWSDKCTSRFGRRRPFILVGSLMISVAVIIIGFSADVGYFLGDTKEHCSTYKGTRTRAAFVFVIGFWMLDLANNTVQGPARALLADLAGPDQRNMVNAVFCSWMAVGNILGFSAGASGSWNRWFPFLMSRACCEACGNLKAAFLVAVLEILLSLFSMWLTFAHVTISICFHIFFRRVMPYGICLIFQVFLTLCTLVTLYFADEVPLVRPEHLRLSDADPLLDDIQGNNHENSKYNHDMPLTGKSNGIGSANDSSEKYNPTHTTSVVDANDSFTDGPGAVLVNLLTSLRHLPPGMHSVLVVMALTWLSWFPFFLFDTDWMGREVYHGDPKGNSDEVKLYDQGVREGAVGLLLNSVVLGISSFLIEPMCQKMGSRLVWAISNFIVFVCMALTGIISLVSVGEYSGGIEHVIGGSAAIRIASLVVFALLGFPLAITYSVPFSVTAELTADSGGGQGLAIGVLNLAIVVPQMIISLGAGPWDALFGGGNIPAFVLASVCAFAAGVIAILKLPNLASSSFKSSGFHFG